jgi:hypothetical protein
MQSSVEVFLDHYNQNIYDYLSIMANRRKHTFEYTKVDDDYHSYCVILGRDYWNFYRNKLIKYVKEHLSHTKVVIEFDRQGDCRDKNIKYTYNGGNEFYVEYESLELSYKGTFNIDVKPPLR